MKKFFKITGSVVFILLIIAVVFAVYQRIYPIPFGIHSKINHGVFSDEAINGYDPVAYFTEGKAVKGIKDFMYKLEDATWYFSSKENLDLFKNDPGKYMPQFGGYCVFAVSKGVTADSDPEVFRIVDEKLYLCAKPDLFDEFFKEKDENIILLQDNWK